MQLLISHKFSDATEQEKGAKMPTASYDKGGPQNIPDVYSVVNADSLETICESGYLGEN